MRRRRPRWWPAARRPRPGREATTLRVTQHGQGQCGEGQVGVGDVAGELMPGDRQARHALQTDVAAGPLLPADQAQQDELDGQRGEGELVPPQPQQGDAGQRGDPGRGHRSGQQAEPRRQAVRGHQGRGVPADQVERRLAERDLAGVPHEHGQAHGHRRREQQQDVHRDLGSGQHDGGEQRARGHRGGDDEARGDPGMFHRAASSWSVVRREARHTMIVSIRARATTVW